MLLSLSLMPMETTRPLNCFGFHDLHWFFRLFRWAGGGSYIAATKRGRSNLKRHRDFDHSRFWLEWLEMSRSQSAASIVNAGRVTAVPTPESKFSMEPEGVTGEGDASSTLTVSRSRNCTGGRDRVAMPTSGSSGRCKG